MIVLHPRVTDIHDGDSEISSAMWKCFEIGNKSALFCWGFPAEGLNMIDAHSNHSALMKMFIILR